MRVSRGAWLVVIALLGALGCARREEEPEVVSFDPDSVPEAYARSTAALAWGGATRAFQITDRGDLANGDWVARIRPSCGADSAGPPRAIAFEDRWLPVAHWRRTSGAVRWDFTATALPEGGAPFGARTAERPAPRDSGLVATLEITATLEGGAPCEARLEVGLGDLDSTIVFMAFDAPDSLGALSFAAPGVGLAHAWSDAPASGDRLLATWPLAPGQSRTLRIVVPAYPTPAARLTEWAKVPHARRLQDSRRHWRHEMEAGARFALGDPEVENAMRAAVALLLTCRERRGDRWLPIGSPIHYRDIWLRDGARAITALALMGRTTEARALAAGLLGYQWPQGAFLSQRGQLDGTGHALWAMEQALLRPEPDRRLEPFTEAALRAVRWGEWQRELGAAVDLPYGTMLPYADPRDNELVRAQLVGTDAWMIAGYRAAARLLRAEGRTPQADSVEQALARYVRDFEAALERTGSADIPPSWQTQGRDWGNLNVGYPCGVLPAGHPRLAALAERVWRTAGGAGLATSAVPESLHCYVGADLGTWALLAGHRAEADSVLAAMLHWRSASGGAAEVFSRITRDFGVNPPPHATSAAALLTLIRNNLVYDDDDTLRLTLGTRPAWWKEASIERAPTRWGLLDLRFSRADDQATWEWSPVPVWTSLTLPPGTVLAGAPPAPLRASAPDVVLAPPRTRSATVTLATRPVP